MTTILVVEDNSGNQEMLTRRLRWEGYEVITANDGEQAIAVAQAQQPDLILMDINIPVLNGWQATEQIKTMPETRSIPVIALTARAFSEDRAHSFASGCDEYEVKPVDFNRLMRKIQTLTASKASS